ncbi:MAG: class I SAM-dependent methyltransferase [Paracoccaceae bacterium]
MTGVGQDHLKALYADGDDPWGFRTSTYEQEKFRATADALSRYSYASALEVGCGNGELARHIAPRCAHYIGVDAVGFALDAARRAVPKGQFVQAYLPCDLPDGPHDLIVLSEVLYFLDHDGLLSLGHQITHRWPAAEVVAVTWLGPTGNPLQGEAALAAFAGAASPTFTATLQARTVNYRIDRMVAP